MSQINLSIAVPLYNEEQSVTELFRRLQIVLGGLNYRYEIVMVNDGSRDKTLTILEKLRTKDKRLKIVSLSRNFGREAAVTAGLDCTSGDMVVIMDGDLQDAPEFIPSLLTKLQEGFDVVYAKHEKRHDPTMRLALFKVFYFVLDRLSSFPIPTEVGTFSVLRRPVVNVLSGLTERNRYLSGLRAWVGFKQVGVYYEKQPRFAGKAPQTVGKLMKMGLDALFSFSYIPLRLATYLGLLVSAFAFLMILDVLYQKFFTQAAILGWASPLISTLFIGGVELLMLGIIGEYLARIYDEVKRRPYYVVAQKIGF